DDQLDYGLDGADPPQDDLDRLQPMRKCGADFVRRRDGFQRRFDRQCKMQDRDIDELKDCGLALREELGVPDAACPNDGQKSELDVVRSAFFQRRAPAEKADDATRDNESASARIEATSGSGASGSL